MECPRCGVSNPGTARLCGCGYAFETQPQIAESERFSMFGTTFRGSQIIQSPATDNAKRHMIWSLVIAGVVPLVLLIPLLWNEVAVFDSLLLLSISAYVAWASYWGIVGVTNALTDLADHQVPDTLVAELAMKLTIRALGLLGLLAAPIVVGILYGTLGGGAYEFLKYRKIVKNPALPSN